MFSFGGGFVGDSGLPPSSVTDLFNGFNRVAGDSYTGGATTVVDNAGALFTAPVNRMGITGARFADNVWLPTAADGSPLWSSQSVRTRKGVVAKYASTFRGFLNEPARTNLFLNSAAPVTQNVTTTAQQYTVSVRGTGSITLSGTATGVATEASPLTVTATAGTLTCTVAGSLQHAQVEAGAFKTSPITTAGATVTRAATVYSRPTAGVLRGNGFGVWGRVVPSAAGQGAARFFVIYVDASNFLTIYPGAGTIAVNKMVAGVTYSVSVPYTYAAGVPFEYQFSQSSANGMQLRVKQDGGAWSAVATLGDAGGKASAALGSTYHIGHLSGSLHTAGHYPFIAIIQHSDPKSELEKLAARYP